MTDEEFPADLGPDVEAAAAEPLDEVDEALLREVAELLDAVDPVPADLVERIQFSLALDELDAEIASITRVEHDALAVRDDPVAGIRTETLTFSSANLTSMVTVTPSRMHLMRLDGWIAPPAAMRVQVRMQEGARDVEADEAGRFVVDDLPEGFAQLAFHPRDVSGAEDLAATVVTPLFQL